MKGLYHTLCISTVTVLMTPVIFVTMRQIYSLTRSLSNPILALWASFYKRYLHLISFKGSFSEKKLEKLAEHKCPF